MPTRRGRNRVGGSPLVLAVALILIGCVQANRVSVCTGEPGFDLWISDLEGDMTSSMTFQVQRLSRIGLRMKPGLRSWQAERAIATSMSSRLTVRG